MPTNTKSLEVTNSVRDVDHHPPNKKWVISITIQAPWLTAGRIIDAIQTIGEKESCTVEIR
jgi:hypothetical protein